MPSEYYLNSERVVKKLNTNLFVINKNENFLFQYLLNDFQKVSLVELDKVKLLDRQDTKFVFNQIHLPLILQKIKPFYRIL